MRQAYRSRGFLLTAAAAHPAPEDCGERRRRGCEPRPAGVDVAACSRGSLAPPPTGLLHSQQGQAMFSHPVSQRFIWSNVATRAVKSCSVGSSSALRTDSHALLTSELRRVAWRLTRRFRKFLAQPVFFLRLDIFFFLTDDEMDEGCGLSKTDLFTNKCLKQKLQNGELQQRGCVGGSSYKHSRKNNEADVKNKHASCISSLIDRQQMTTCTR